MIDKPNILLIMADQLVPFLTGAYGHPVVQTPNLDRLAAGGIRFDAAYTPYPLCAPARVAMLTGRYASRIGCFDNAALYPADQPTLAHYLTNAGHETVLSGKMHFIGPDQLHGFGKRLTTDIFPANIIWVPDPTGAEQGEHAKSYILPNVGVRPWTKFLAYDEETQFRALEYLRNRGFLRQTDPFFLTVSFHNPHDPFHVIQELWDLYEGQPIEIPEFPHNVGETYSEMVRRGKYKYVYIHRYGRQLFDLEADPDEWCNLSGEPALKDVESDLERAILARFDPESLAKAGLESIKRRLVIREASRRNDAH